MAAWRYVRRPGPLELSVLSVFAAFGSLFLLSVLNVVAPTFAPVFRPILVPILFLQPILALRLVNQFQPVPTAITQGVIAGAVLAIVAVVAFPGQTLATLPAVGYFFVAQTIAALRFAAASQRRFGMARIRLALASVATAMFGASLLIAGLGAALNGGASSPSVQAASRLAGILAAVGYLAAFVAPSWMRRFAYRALAFDLVRSLVAPPVGTDAGRLWEQLAGTAREILGARTVRILAEPGGRVLTSVGETAAAVEAGAAPIAAPDEAAASRKAPVSRIEVRVRAPGGPSEELEAEIEGRPLFVEDDVALLQLLGSLTARAVDREGALIGLGEAKRAIEESAVVKASEARFRALLEADPNAVLALDEAGKVTWATGLAGELFGTVAENLVGVPLGDLVVLHADHDRPAGSTPTTERRIFRAETTGRRADGTRFPAELARAEFELDGRRFQLAVISDISWRHEADQIRERFLGVLSHELRTPVTSIYGGTQLLLGRGARLDPATRAELLVGVAAESERLQRMIENLVAMARIERGAEYPGPRPVLLERIIKGLIDRERALWPEVTIKLVSHGPVSMVAADEEYLAQIMRNLLSNAAKYGGPGSTVEVQLVDGEQEVQIVVRDDGPGIDEEDADKLFNLYYRAAPAAATAPGAGIGLFVCRELVATMGGRIWARPRPEGGSEFGFSLPTYPDEPEPYQEPVPATDATKPVAVGAGPAPSAA